MNSDTAIEIKDLYKNFTVYYDKFTKNYLAQKNDEWRKNYEKLKAEDPNNLYYVTCEGLSGYDNEGTVDGIHFTDLGFRAYADKLIEILKFVVD